jgi:hypothetical protein
MSAQEPTALPVNRAPHVFHRVGPVAVRPGSHAEVPIFVSGLPGPVEEIAVSVHVLRQGMEKVSLSLVSPAMEAVLLSIHHGGTASAFGTSCGDPVTFRDFAARSIADARPPVAGPYRPTGALAAFRGLPERVANGCWRLVVIDAGRGDVGAVLMSATLSVWAR